MEKRFLSMLLALTMVLSLFPMSVLAAETPAVNEQEVSNTIVKDNLDLVTLETEEEWQYVEAQDVEIYVTDGYIPIPCATVLFDGKKKETDTEGKVVFQHISAGDEPHFASASAEGFGTKESEIYVSEYIRKDENPVMEYTFSFWTPSNRITTSVLSPQRPYAKMQAKSVNVDFEEDYYNNAWVISSQDSSEFSSPDGAYINGKVYIANRRNNCFSIYDVANDTWSQTSTSPVSIIDSSHYLIAVDNGLMYYMSGNSVGIYDTATDLWARGESYKYQGVPEYGELVDRKLYLFTKFAYYLNDVSIEVNCKMGIYNLDTNQWGTDSFIEDPVIFVKDPETMEKIEYRMLTQISGSVYCNDTVYAFWNSHSIDDAIEQVLAYDIPSKTWTDVTDEWYEGYDSLGLSGPLGEPQSITRAIRGSWALYQGTRLYFVGGRQTYDTTQDLCYYDLSTKTWTKCADIPVRLADASVVIGDSKIYVMGGMNGNITEEPGVYDTASFYIYDIESGTWSEGPDLPYIHRNSKSIYGDGRVFLWGGNSSPQNGYLKMFTLGTHATHVSEFDPISVRIGTNIDVLQSALQTQYPTADVTFSDGTDSTLPINWDLSEDTDCTETRGVKTIYGAVDYSGIPNYVVMPRSNAKVQVIVQAAVESSDEFSVSVPQGMDLADMSDYVNELFPEITVQLSDGTTETLPVTWNTYTVNNEQIGPQSVNGTLDLTDHPDVTSGDFSVALTITVLPMITAVSPLEPITVKEGTTPEKVQKQLEDNYSLVNVRLSTGLPDLLPVTWNVSASDYDGGICGDYTIYGEITVDESKVLNPDKIRANILVIVAPPSPFDIVSVDPVSMEAPQYMLLGQTEKSHVIGGVPTTIDLPKTANVHLYGGESRELPVNWDVTGFNPTKTGDQEFEGEFVLSDDSEIENTEDLKPTLVISITPAQYDVLEVSTDGASVEVLPGASLAEVQAQFEAEGKAEVHVDVFNTRTDDEIYTYCALNLNEAANPDWASQMDIPGEYELKISMPEDFTEIDGSILDEQAAKVKVTVLPPLDIIEVKPADMEAYQSVEPENMENVPQQVTAILSNDMEIPIDVEWKWAESGYQKDLAGSQVVVGELVNLPSKAKQPESGDLPGTLNVNVVAVEYEVTDMQYEDIFEAKTLLTLEEITELLKPTVTLTISSVTPGITVNTTYEAEISLETEKNPDFNMYYAELYPLNSTLQIPSNIAVPTDTYLSEVILQTIPAEVKEIEPIRIMVGEGTEYGDIEKPEGAVVTFDAMGPDGEYKKKTVEVDWGIGEGYNPYPEDLTEETPVEMTVYGLLSGNSSEYANVAGVPVPLIITVVRAYEITEITPNRFPASGAMEVKLGSTIEDIYESLDTHMVELELKALNGSMTSKSITFQLREEDNPDYDAMTEGTYTLTAFLSLPTGVSNPKDLKIEIVVKTTKYTISSVKGERIGGIVSGTAFEDIPLPGEVTVNLTNGGTDVAGVAEWDGSSYDPMKIGSQVVRGTLAELPVHLENPNNRQPSAVVTVVNPDVRIVSLQLITGQTTPKKLRAISAEDTSVPGYKEYRYIALIQHKDGTISEEIISTYVETAANK